MGQTKNLLWNHYIYENKQKNIFDRIEIKLLTIVWKYLIVLLLKNIQFITLNFLR